MWERKPVSQAEIIAYTMLQYDFRFAVNQLGKCTKEKWEKALELYQDSKWVQAQENTKVREWNIKRTQEFILSYKSIAA